MRILVVTRSALNLDDNMGNTLSNLFSGIDNCEIHSLYLRSDQYTNHNCKTVYQISEQQLIKSIFSHKDCGIKVDLDHVKIEDIDQEKEKKQYDAAKKLNLSILWFVRELIWSFGKWKTETLKKYLDEVKPNIVFIPSFNCWYPYKVLDFIIKYTGAKFVLYHADDNYSLSQYHLSPFYWIYRFNLRKKIKQAVSKASLNYCISDYQRKKYDEYFHIESKLLQKSLNFKDKPANKDELKFPLKMVFTGNASSGRWKTLTKIANALSEINSEKIIAQLYIYTATKLSDKEKQMLIVPNSCFLMNKVSPQEVKKIQDSADILVHVESFSKMDRQTVKMSFSTKIVDYLAAGKCVLAVGPDDVASIDYFISNKSGYVISTGNETEIKEKLLLLISNENLIKDFADAAWICGNENHNEVCIKESFTKDLARVCNNI